MCLYVNTGKIVFSMAGLSAGQEGALDPGYQDAHKIACLIKGRVVLEFPDDTPRWIELRAGDVVLGEEVLLKDCFSLFREVEWLILEFRKGSRDGLEMALCNHSYIDIGPDSVFFAGLRGADAHHSDCWGGGGSCHHCPHHGHRHSDAD